MYRGGSATLPVVANSSVPAGVNYDMAGAGRKETFNKTGFLVQMVLGLCRANDDWGVHLIDMVLLGMKARNTKSVMATGGKYGIFCPCLETPDI